jgi:hypothetical protein
MKTCEILLKALCHCKEMLKACDLIYITFISQCKITTEMITISKHHAGYVE